MRSVDSEKYQTSTAEIPRTYTLVVVVSLLFNFLLTGYAFQCLKRYIRKTNFPEVFSSVFWWELRLVCFKNRDESNISSKH